MDILHHIHYFIQRNILNLYMFLLLLLCELLIIIKCIDTPTPKDIVTQLLNYTLDAQQHEDKVKEGNARIIIHIF